ESACERIGTADPHLAFGRISKEFDVADALFELIECRQSAPEQRATIDRRLDPRGVRSNSRTPNACSRPETTSETAGWVTPSSFAALAMLRHCTTEKKTCRSRKRRRRLMRFSGAAL